MEKVDIMPVHQSNNTKWFVAAGVTLLTVVIVACTVIAVVHINSNNTKLQWVGFKGSFEGRNGYMNEESEVDPDRRVIIHVNAEGYKLGINNSISLHDYQNGLLATRVMETGTCMIINLIDTYEEAVAALKQFNKTGVSTLRPMRWFDDGVVINQSELDEQIGSTLADFCRGFPTVRLHEVPAGSISTRERRSADRTTRAVCIQNEFSILERVVRRLMDLFN